MVDRRVHEVPRVGYWCTVCLKHLNYDQIWLSDDTRDGRHFCYSCAPGDAIRAKDTMQPVERS